MPPIPLGHVREAMASTLQLFSLRYGLNPSTDDVIRSNISSLRERYCPRQPAEAQNHQPRPRNFPGHAPSWPAELAITTPFAIGSPRSVEVVVRLGRGSVSRFVWQPSAGAPLPLLPPLYPRCWPLAVPASNPSIGNRVIDRQCPVPKASQNVV